MKKNTATRTQIGIPINTAKKDRYLYDDRFTLIINASKKPLSIENIPLDDIEEAFEGENTETEGCSSMMTPAPPDRARTRFAFGLFSYLKAIFFFTFLQNCGIISCEKVG